MAIDYAGNPTQNDTASNQGSSVSVGASSATILAANANRIEATISNTHASNYLTLSLGGTAVAGAGIYLPPGATYVTTTYTGQINGIASGASTGVGVTEVSF